MTDEHRLFILIQRASEEQTETLAKVVESHTKLLRNEIRTNVKEVEVRLGDDLKEIEDLKKKTYPDRKTTEKKQHSYIWFTTKKRLTQHHTDQIERNTRPGTSGK